jgi:hypothetical protein
MGERLARRRRVLVEDARHQGHHLRVTWHPDERQFVVSTWSRDVCTGSARLATDDAAALATLLVDGLADAAATPVPVPALPPARAGVAGLVDRLRWLVRGTTPPAAGRSSNEAGAVVRPLRSA